MSVRVGGSARGGWRHESEQRERQRQNEGERVWGRENGRKRKIVKAHGREKVCVCALAHVDYIYIYACVLGLNSKRSANRCCFWWFPVLASTASILGK